MQKQIAAGLLWMMGHASWAQCAMCKATAESGQAAGSAEATGLNAGILYLMAIPYVLMAAVALVWYRSQKNKSARL
jgi:hypothetical protein